MEIVQTRCSREDLDRKRLFLSLAGASLLATLGFGLIYFLFAWLPFHLMLESRTWIDRLPQMKTLLPAGTFLLSLFTTAMGTGGLLLSRRKLRIRAGRSATAAAKRLR